MADEESTRDRVRALVRDVLNNALPAEDDEAAGASSAGVGPTVSPTAPTPASDAPPTRFIQTAPKPSTVPSEVPEYTRDESSKMVITETDVHGLEEGARLRIAEGARLTPLAADIVRERRIELVRRQPRRGSKKTKMVAVGADHGGYQMKEELKGLLAELGQQVRDYGTNSEEAVDYPDFAHAVARAVSDGAADVGIIIDGAGVGSCMTANKVPGVRAAACYSVAVAKNSREHNDANVLALGSKTITAAEMREIVKAWLSTELTEDRHRKRVAKITAVERQYNS
ncbi:MAG TPA: ribose 5-phosphate isomerase B [Pyrinomonadaceae bacterium]|nr:ribose 5-phosphate isomerase B [Pyrinomonadaceae bacterium]